MENVNNIILDSFKYGALALVGASLSWLTGYLLGSALGTFRKITK